MKNNVITVKISLIQNKIREILADETTGAKLFLVAWCIFLCGETLSTTMFPVPNRMYMVCRAAPVLLILIKVLLFDNYHVRSFWLSVFLVMIGAAVLFFSGYMEPLLWIIMLLGARNVSWRKILQIYIYIVDSIVFLAFCASLLDVIENLQYEVDGGDIVRNSFGSIYTTDFASHIFSVTLALFYLMKERLNIWHYVIVSVIAVLVFRFCNTRLDVSCLFMLVGAFLFLNLWRRRRTVAKQYRSKGYTAAKWMWFMPFTMILMTAATVLYNPNNSFLKILDQIVSGRLEFGKQGLTQYGFSLFGQQVEMVGNGGTTIQLKDYFFVDCSYLYIFLRYGFLFLLIVLAVYMLCCRKFQSDPYFLIAIILISINCMIAHHLIELSYNPFALALLASAPAAAVREGRIKGNIGLKQGAGYGLGNSQPGDAF